MFAGLTTSPVRRSSGAQRQSPRVRAPRADPCHCMDDDIKGRCLPLVAGLITAAVATLGV
eukprot:scaffold418_cov386-Prasinococcus_capsulatus_cf.AAC.3